MKLITAPFSLAWKALKTAPLAAAAWIVYSSWFVDHDLPLPDPLAAEPTYVDSGRGPFALYRRGPSNAPSVLLVHSVNAAASAAEMRPLFDRLALDHDVIAMDLPGYGKSDRTAMVYDIDTMTGGVQTALESIGRPSHIVALSLGAEFAARAETIQPELVASLTLISPTGFSADDVAPPGQLGDVLRTPIIGQALFDALTSKPSIDYFLSKSFTGEVDPGLSSYAYLTAHQPNAVYAPASFLAGTLFTRNAVETLYDRVSSPVLVLFDEDPYSLFDELAPFTSRKEAWTAQRIPDTCGLPHFDAPDETADAIRRFIGEVE